jgi:hypothetical protein
MSNAIGGGGGNFNPLGPIGDLVGGLMGGIGKMLQGPDLSSIAEIGKTILNKVGSFADAGAALGGSQTESSQQSALTEFAPSKDIQKAVQGYGTQAMGDDAADDEPPVQGEMAQSSSAMTVQGSSVASDSESPEIGQSSSAATAETPSAAQAEAAEIQKEAAKNYREQAEKLNQASPGTGDLFQTFAAEADQKAAEILATSPQAYAASQQKASVAEQKAEFQALSVLAANFNEIEGNAFQKDGKFDEGNIRWAAEHSSSAQVKQAAQYLLDHPQLMTELQLVTGDGQGLVSVQALSAYMVKAMGGSGQGGIHTVDPVGSNGTGTNGTNGTNGTSGTPGTCDGAGPGGSGGAGGAHQTGPAAHSLDEKINQMGTSLEDKQARLLELMRLEDEGKLNGPENQGLRDEMRKLPNDIQKTIQRLTELNNLVSNLMKAFHDMSMNSIRHIG